MLWSEDIVVGECIVFQIIMRYKHMTWSPPPSLRLETVSLSTSRRVIKMDNFLISRSVTFPPLTSWDRHFAVHSVSSRIGGGDFLFSCSSKS